MPLSRKPPASQARCRGFESVVRFAESLLIATSASSTWESRLESASLERFWNSQPDEVVRPRQTTGSKSARESNGPQERLNGRGVARERTRLDAEQKRDAPRVEDLLPARSVDNVEARRSSGMIA